MYSVDFKCEDNFFSDSYIYQIHCIGKAERQTGFQSSERYYFFASHGRLYQVSEIVNTIEDIKVTIEQVKKYTLPKGTFKYSLYADTEEYGVKRAMLEEVKNQCWHKSGFYVFKQMYYQSNLAVLGGIDDIYNFTTTTYNGLLSALEEARESYLLKK